MGCDIHFFVERKTSDNNYYGPRDLVDERHRKIGDIIGGAVPEERWVSADLWDFGDDGWEMVSDYFGDRNYSLFALLADVRNDGSINPLDEPRGIPDDASTGYLYKAAAWEYDAHSHSYFTLAELQRVDWKALDFYTDGFERALEEMALIDDDPEKVRCCFFFDN